MRFEILKHAYDAADRLMLMALPVPALLPLSVGFAAALEGRFRLSPLGPAKAAGAKRKQKQAGARLLALPDETILVIVSYLLVGDIAELSAVCRQLRQAASVPSVWLDRAVAKWWPGQRGVGARATRRQRGGQRARARRIYASAQAMPSMPEPSSLPSDVALLSPSARDTFHYTGAVGEANRCVLAGSPLPRPRRRATLPAMVTRTLKLTGASELDFLRRQIAALLAPPQPFVTPHALSSGEMCVQPRLVSYYEVSILRDPGVDAAARRVPPPHAEGRRVAPCVAVGLALDRFEPEDGRAGRMPGWDHFSYGYHGDDGGFFHEMGVMACSLGPTFSAGDTVGCGVDYGVRGGSLARIFFTLNGKFLAYAVDVPADEDFYPVVGIDANTPVRLNFGEKPFLYRLQAHGNLGAGAPAKGADALRTIAVTGLGHS